jgi:hypothetical protein
VARAYSDTLSTTFEQILDGRGGGAAEGAVKANALHMLQVCGRGVVGWVGGGRGAKKRRGC